MADNNDLSVSLMLEPFEHQDDPGEPVDHVHVAFSLGVSVVELVSDAVLLDFGVELAQLLESDTVADAGIDLIQLFELVHFPMFLNRQAPRGGPGSVQIAGPDHGLALPAQNLLEMRIQLDDILLALLTQRRVSSDPIVQVVLALAVSRQVDGLLTVMFVVHIVQKQDDLRLHVPTQIPHRTFHILLDQHVVSIRDELLLQHSFLYLQYHHILILLLLYYIRLYLLPSPILLAQQNAHLLPRTTFTISILSLHYLAFYVLPLQVTSQLYAHSTLVFSSPYHKYIYLHYVILYYIILLFYFILFYFILFYYFIILFYFIYIWTHA